MSQLVNIGGSALLGNLLVSVIVRELGPLITALIVIARTCPSAAAEVGNMKVNKEIEALEVLGINPLSFIVFPRLAGGVLSVICLSCYFVFIAFVGGYMAVSLSQNFSLFIYIDTFAMALTLNDIFFFFLKSIFGGLIIFAISCFQGLQVKTSFHEVPALTASAVVSSVIFVVGFNLTISILSYIETMMKLGLL